MSNWKQRLTRKLEPILRETDPRSKISTYSNMPFAILRYPPDAEFAIRGEISMLSTRLEQAGKRVTVISLARCLEMALDREGITSEEIKMAEGETGTSTMVDTIHKVLSEYQPLDALVAELFPPQADPLVDIVLIMRAGALFPFYRTSSLLEQLTGKVEVPTVLFYPGELDGAAGLRFMGVMDAEHNYRPNIY